MKKILVVDDQAQMVQILSDILVKEGYQVVTAYNGLIGIQKAITFLPDLIIMDIMMPVKNGIDAVKELRQMEAFQSTPIIILTAKGGFNDRAAAMEAGANLFIEKPFSPIGIISEVAKLI